MKKLSHSWEQAEPRLGTLLVPSRPLFQQYLKTGEKKTSPETSLPVTLLLALKEESYHHSNPAMSGLSPPRGPL